MPTYIAFLRAVNVAPRWVKMARVNTLLPEHGYAEVATHIQSGNLRVTTPTRGAAKVAAHLRTVLSEEFGFDIPTIVRTPPQLRELVGTVEGVPAPLPDARRYIAFLQADPSAKARSLLEGWDNPGERAAVVGPRRSQGRAHPRREMGPLTSARPLTGFGARPRNKRRLPPRTR